jgi:hypothetical protein
LFHGVFLGVAVFPALFHGVFHGVAVFPALFHGVFHGVAVFPALFHGVFHGVAVFPALFHGVFHEVFPPKRLFHAAKAPGRFGVQPLLGQAVAFVKVLPLPQQSVLFGPGHEPQVLKGDHPAGVGLYM